MRYNVTDTKITKFSERFKKSQSEYDLKAMKAYTKVALIENGKIRQAHKLDDIGNLSLQAQHDKCMEFARQVFEIPTLEDLAGIFGKKK
jgi:hypothetical protein